jgi:HAD superfamily phosphatase (TIGR01668 family)
MLPDYYYESVFTVPYNDLRKQNIRGLIFDLDNTLALYTESRPTAKVSSLIKRLQRMGFVVSLLTNNVKKRADTFNEKMHLTAVHGGLKPFATGVRRAMAAMGTTPEETVMIGDQLLADVWAGKNAKITTILVKPMGKDVITVRWKRGIERLMLKKFHEQAKRTDTD